MNKVKKFGILAVALLVCAQISGAATLTGTPDRVAANNSDWSKKYWDQSTYPSPGVRHGTIVRTYDFSLDGGAAGAISLEKGKSGGVTNIPDNTVIVGGFVEVITPVLPATTSTNSLMVNSVGDILATGTNMTVAGIFPIVPVWTAGTAVKADGSSNTFDLVITGAAVTQGFVTVYLDCYYGQ